MDRHQWLAERFEEHCSRLRPGAYTMLGSLGDADDAIQLEHFNQHQSRPAPHRIVSP
jgi:RNA polymerase sigma-70 factor, ECF subfamily